MKLFSVLACLLFLSACDSVAFDTESLLRPPTLNTQQAQVYEALESTLTSMNIVYKYPQGGEHRSPFIFYDMDGDDVKEAIVFYSYQNDTSNTRVQILLQQEDKSWVPFHDFTTACDQVEFVQFSPMLSTSSHCLVIGWANTARISQSPQQILSIYSLEGGVFHPEVEQTYYDYVIHDFDGDKLEELVVIDQGIAERGVGKQYNATLLRASGRHIAAVSSLPMAPETFAILNMTCGRLWDNTQAVYIDATAMGNINLAAQEGEAIADNESVVTEVFRVTPQGLEPLVSGSQQERAILSEAWDNYEYTYRDMHPDRSQNFFCQDVDGDGVVEVPNPVSLPGVTEDASGTLLQLTQLMHLTVDGFMVQESAVVNQTEHYLVYYPERWLDRVTVMMDSEADEWKFYLVDADSGEPASELLRIQSYSSAGQSSDPESGLIELGARGSRHYAGYIPRTTDEELAITETDLKSMFVLL